MERMGLGRSGPLCTNIRICDKHEYEEVAKLYTVVYFETIPEQHTFNFVPYLVGRMVFVLRMNLALYTYMLQGHHHKVQNCSLCSFEDCWEQTGNNTQSVTELAFFASFEEDAALRDEKWNERYNGQRTVMWSGANIRMASPSDASLN
jgi:hypothetical protein